MLNLDEGNIAALQVEKNRRKKRDDIGVRRETKLSNMKGGCWIEDSSNTHINKENYHMAKVMNVIAQLSLN